jgi:hypothetical protein
VRELVVEVGVVERGSRACGAGLLIMQLRLTWSQQWGTSERAVSNGVELVGVSVVLGSPSDLGERSEDELGSGVPLADRV